MQLIRLKPGTVSFAVHDPVDFVCCSMADRTRFGAVSFNESVIESGFRENRKAKPQNYIR
ncbi:MAG: hypothetical protein ACLRL6_02370 [Clostridium sp.]